MPPKIDITGQRFGRLVAVKPTDKRNSNGSIVWECRCDCGNTAYMTVSALRYNSKNSPLSCGCGKHINYLKRVKANKHSQSGVRGVLVHRDGDDNINGYVVTFRGKYIKMFSNIGEATECYTKLKSEYLKGAVV